VKRSNLVSITQAALAALLFGASTPLAKLLLGEVDPVLLAALLYLGSGISLAVIKLIQRTRSQPGSPEAPLIRQDVPWLLGAIFFGGIAAPITLLFSLKSTPAATSSLLLNFEGVATTLIAALIFKEAVSRRAWVAVGLITLAGILLSLNPGAGWGFSPGALGIVIACGFWGLDNNFTRNISAKDPLTIVAIKGMAAGSFSLVLALLLKNPVPGAGVILGAMVLGSLSYGASIVLFILAMRGMGAARTSALFGMAPLAGMILSLVIFRGSIQWILFLAAPLMAAGALLFIGEEHQHEHRHAETSHEHAHTHPDEHHDHAHDGFTGRHSHPHDHPEVVHNHHHMPDIPHRHSHPQGS